jgi:quercetin dioxygenase-like cupin family protein
MATLSKWISAVVPFSLLIAAAAKVPQGSGDHPSASIHTPQSIEWKAGPPALPSGASAAVLEGDPQQEGPFTMRLRFPDGYKIPPHTHPKVEHVTVLSGTFHLGIGEVFDQAASQAMPAGTFGFWPAGMKHFAWTKGETVVQVHGIGPWKIEYLNPADDPRNSGKSGK